MFDPLYRVEFSVVALLRDHPPRFQHTHKAALFELAYPAATAPTGMVEVTRWPSGAPTSLTFGEAGIVVQPDFFDYAAVDPAAVEWHVNFADPNLFYAYGSRLFAQDEMQVAEHPILACVRQALLATGRIAMTCDCDGPTPILVRNVERRLAIATNPNAAAGRPAGLYGNRFAGAPFEVVRRATRVIDPPTVSNIIAMAAPPSGHGDYTAATIESIFSTAHTAFEAAVHESGGRRTVVHTGFWGCGAFGGNRRLMVALQVLAARSAGVATIVLHAGDEAGATDAADGVATAERVARRCGSPCDVRELLVQTEMLGCRWGVSDGN